MISNQCIEIKYEHNKCLELNFYSILDKNLDASNFNIIKSGLEKLYLFIYLKK